MSGFYFLTTMFLLICMYSFWCWNGRNDVYCKWKSTASNKPYHLDSIAVIRTDWTLFKVTPASRISPVYGIISFISLIHFQDMATQLACKIHLLLPRAELAATLQFLKKNGPGYCSYVELPVEGRVHRMAHLIWHKHFTCSGVVFTPFPSCHVAYIV